MDSLQLLRPSSAAVVGGRVKQVQEAKEMERAIQERAKRSDKDAPSYELLELIGKGSFGRVFRSRKPFDQSIVAVKIIEVDESDYKGDKREKDQALKDFFNEINILKTLKDHKAKNINIIHEAFEFHSQLWIVSDYCPGGSVHTLMRASPQPGLEEKYIVAISRELAIALKHVHEAGIIHRDVKAANVLITQDGQLQLCDFGVSGIIEHSSAKRSTIIGTPFWMAPELYAENATEQGYGKEVDCWAFGCTVYELATGQPPNAKIAPNRLALFLERAPRLDGDYSAALKEFVSFCLVERPEDRPAADSILKHSYLANSNKRYPTSSLRQLLERYVRWEQGGGQRVSLFDGYGAAGPAALEDFDEDESWNFSTTPDFSQRISQQYLSVQTPTADSFVFDENTPIQPFKKLSPFEKAKEEERIARGGRMMGRLFDLNAEPYEFLHDDEEAEESEPYSDLPLRSLSTPQASNRETIIDLDAAFSEDDGLDLANVPTIRPMKKNQFYEEDEEEQEQARIDEYQQNLTKRLTKDWKMPLAMTISGPEISRPRTQDWTMPRMAVDDIEETDEIDLDEIDIQKPQPSGLGLPFRPQLRHTATMPTGHFNDHIHAPVGSISLSSEADRSSMIDLDGPSLSRSSTNASSFSNLSAITDLNSGGNPFDLEENAQRLKIEQRISMHTHSQSEPKAERMSSQMLSNQHNRGSSLSSQTEKDHQRVFSVQETMQSLRQEPNSDDYWKDGLIPELRERKRSIFDEPPIPRKFERSVTSNTFMSESENSTVDDSDTSMDLTMPLKQPRRSIHTENSVATSRAESALSRQKRRNYHEQSSARSQSDILPEREYLTPVPVVEFPQILPPNSAALEEDADTAVVVSELERLLDDYISGLKVARNLMKDTNEWQHV